MHVQTNYHGKSNVNVAISCAYSIVFLYDSVDYIYILRTPIHIYNVCANELSRRNGLIRHPRPTNPAAPL